MKCVSVAMVLAVSPFFMAQSSITIYGLPDVLSGYQKSTVNGQNTSLSMIGNNGQMSRRLGFIGSEDLGGGYRANVTFENGFDPSTPREPA